MRNIQVVLRLHLTNNKLINTASLIFENHCVGGHYEVFPTFVSPMGSSLFCQLPVLIHQIF